MTATTFNSKAAKSENSLNENSKNTEKPKKSTAHLLASTKYYTQGMKLKEAGENDKANKSFLKSKIELRLASEAIKEELDYQEIYF